MPQLLVHFRKTLCHPGAYRQVKKAEMRHEAIMNDIRQHVIMYLYVEHSQLRLSLSGPRKGGRKMDFGGRRGVMEQKGPDLGLELGRGRRTEGKWEIKSKQLT